MCHACSISCLYAFTAYVSSFSFFSYMFDCLLPIDGNMAFMLVLFLHLYALVALMLILIVLLYILICCLFKYDLYVPVVPYFLIYALNALMFLCQYALMSMHTCLFLLYMLSFISLSSSSSHTHTHLLEVFLVYISPPAGLGVVVAVKPMCDFFLVGIFASDYHIALC